MLDDLLLGKTRAAVLREIYTNPGRRLSFNELVRRLKSGPGAISRELATLATAGLLSEHREGNQRFVSACTSSPLYGELRAFISKASGAPAFVREALRGLEDRIDLALIFGSVAASTERADSDLDIFVVGTAGYSVVTQRMYSIEERLGRRVQTLYFDANSAVDRASLRKPSTRSLLSGPKLFVLGDEAKLQALLSAAEETENGQKSKSGQSRKRRKTRAARRRA
jgi:predicted nucleotidyltransferase